MRRFMIPVLAVFSLGGVCHAQVGPDLINASMSDIARHGTNAAGTITGYSCGSVTCNHGDMPLAAMPDAATRPLVGMNMYRYKNYGLYSRLEQLGQGWAKWVAVPVNGTNVYCGGACGTSGVGSLGPNCADVYGSGFNSPGGMGARSRINPATGVLTGTRGGGTGETNINTRVQVATTDVTAQPVGTRFFFETVDLLPDDATYVRPGQHIAINAMNNATAQEININGGTSAPTFIGAPTQVPVIGKWKEIDTTVTTLMADHDDTLNPNASFPGTTIRCRYHIAAQATAIGGGRWRYEYAVFNLNSDRACGSFSVPLAAGASITDVFFRSPPAHSGEPFSNAAWTATHTGSVLTFATEPYSANVNANAIRWGTMYNFGFTTPVPPSPASATLGLFKPGALASINAPGVPAPVVPACAADINVDAAVEIGDLLMFLDLFQAGDPRVDMDGDGGVTIEDLLFFLPHYAGGC